MTKKELQEMDNIVALELFKEFQKDIEEVPVTLKGVQLRHCQAWVYETPEYYILKSYETIIAFIIKEDDILVDMLRHVYGYTATSAQHTAKFNTDYGKAKYGCIQRITYKEV